MAVDPEAPLPGAPDPWVASSMPAWRDGPPYAMTEMIAAEPALAERLVGRLTNDPAVAELAGAVREAADRGAPVTVLGCGTSEHAAQAIAAIWTDALRLEGGHEVRFAQALETLARPQADGVVVGVSHEGGTAATNDALAAAAAAGAQTALITAGRGSPGAAQARTVIATGEQDQSWCHTVGYLSPVLAGTAVAVSMNGSALDPTAVRALLDVADDARGAEAVGAALASCTSLLVAGSGADRASARELALKVAEGAHLPALALALETVLHGHLAAAGPSTGFVLILTEPSAGALGRARDVLRAVTMLGMPAAAILGADLGDAIDRALTPAGRLAVPETSRVEAVPASLIGAAIPIQLLAERLARARGVNPDTLGRDNPAQAAAHS